MSGTRLRAADDVPFLESVDSTFWVPPRLTMNLDKINIVHFSGQLKMWDRDYLNSESVDDFVTRMLRINSPYAVRLWLDRKGDYEDYAAYGLVYEGGSSDRWMLHFLLKQWGKLSTWRFCK